MIAFKHSCYSVGFLRDDYSFELLATFNNNGGILGNSTFSDFIERTIDHFQKLYQDNSIVALPREDADDILHLDEDELFEYFNIEEESQND